MDANTIAVWLIEDDALFRDTVAAVLSTVEDIACTGRFVTCEEALERLAAADGDSRITDVQGPDVILLDIGLPGMGGLEGIPRLRTAAPQAEIVILTVHEDSDRVFDAISRGASGYVLKPSTAEGIVRAVRAAYRGESPITPRIARRILDRFKGTPPEYGLSDRERDVLELMVTGMTKRAMAEALTLSVHTIDQHVRHIYAKLDVNTRGLAVAKAVGEGLLGPRPTE
ncbi:MAG: response regulator transcription factor [Rhodothermales bacterium]